MGIPSALYPQGTEIAGSDAMFTVTVHISARYIFTGSVSLLTYLICYCRSGRGQNNVRILEYLVIFLYNLLF